mmetsp:Transcript_95539/g.270083  ORF Transcript_95539/g.270083 Transcript_95539/m.270083 type:complete len:568 (+) Transcript_95539:95-1798(+)|eukprot:CAMPEP_0168380860 /NCGR_PEP_ID=MMETSP0228-20121227/12578_1 /TAXON_ID=133427 /ORGANISM="Protoceratium reticulatum, Strain CCCM 535 (=CCMP 1889)" /LENGTH=567 /DNA_ID=CAMNT_0008393939 /DNA_START=64 /DNA_END=1767 /DNA_ORIENTATION=-
MVGQVWQVVGGKKDGIVVREGSALASAEVAGGRLACGSALAELELKGERLHFKRLSGSGPREGWVSLKMKGSDLVAKTDRISPTLWPTHEGRAHALCCAVCESGHMLPTLRIARALARRECFWRVTFVTNAFGARTVEGWLRAEPDETGKLQLRSFEDGTDETLMRRAHEAAQEEDGSVLGQVQENIAAHCGECLEPLLSGEDRVTCAILDTASLCFQGFLRLRDPPVPVLTTMPLSVLAATALDKDPSLLDSSKAAEVDVEEVAGGQKDILKRIVEAKGKQVALGTERREVPTDLPSFSMLQCFELPPLLSAIMDPPPHYMFPLGLIVDEGRQELPQQVRDFIELKGAPPVLYVSMGSQAAFTAEQLRKVVEGLRAPEWRVLWSLREQQQDLLPGVFGSLGEGFMIMTWCPQLEILRHVKVAAFMSHCGWGACCEAMITATPVVGFPMFGDQPLNSIFLEMMGMARTVGAEPLSQEDPKVTEKRIASMMSQRAGKEPRLRDVFTADLLRDQVREVVVNRQYKMSANGIKNYAKASGGVHRAVEAVEAYCGGPAVQYWLEGSSSVPD